MFLSEVEEENNSSDKTYTTTTIPKEDIADNYESVLSSFGLFTKDKDCDLPSMDWIP